jgi:hypothetical protein
MNGAVGHIGIIENSPNISDMKREQIKHIATVHDALERLPNFERCSISEIISIRKELDKFLSRFRAAMLEYSETIKTMPWDKDFSNEVSILFLKKIDPCVEEIRNVVEQNSILRILCTNVLNDNILTGAIVGSIGVAISPLPEAILPVIVAGGLTLGKTILNTYDDYLQENQKSQSNALYFYYQAGKMMKRI